MEHSITNTSCQEAAVVRQKDTSILCGGTEPKTMYLQSAQAYL